MSSISKSLYLPLSAAFSVVGGLVAGKIFSVVWERIDDSGDGPPDPRDLNRSGAQALFAAGVQGLVFGLVKAAVDRAGARSYRAVAHENPV
ncbi:DUF4235 domain-containing protein [Mycolicibacterium mucogenicum]|uniref:DUF4235 domain-containing protein n=1 Tax=Mycolicibacterium TaxID=1866885 RepID=UPI002269C654|nr:MULTISPECIES: DUF4235 domain-containing protein [Mycolicibacterium]MCX8563965.1 DUF4235 domain-containing protein [Mycolicibacterium mucogenicum]